MKFGPERHSFGSLGHICHVDASMDASTCVIPPRRARNGPTTSAKGSRDAFIASRALGMFYFIFIYILFTNYLL